MIYDTETMLASSTGTRRSLSPLELTADLAGPRFDTSTMAPAPVRTVASRGSATPGSLPSSCDALAIYFRELSRYPRISAEEEIALARRVQQGDEEARERMITANLRLVVKIAREFEGFGLPLLDLISEGNIGLMKAVDRFDPERGARLSGYACYWIKQVIRRALANQTRTIRLPVHVHEKLLHISQVAQRLQLALGRTATDDEISLDTGISADRIRRFRDAAHPAVSLDHSPSDDDKPGLAESLGDASAAAPDVELAWAADVELMREYLPVLGSRERCILERRFGLDGEGERTLEEVGEEIGLTRERVRQLQELALKRLRRLMEQRDCAAVAA